MSFFHVSLCRGVSPVPLCPEAETWLERLDRSVTPEGVWLACDHPHWLASFLWGLCTRRVLPWDFCLDVALGVAKTKLHRIGDETVRSTLERFLSERGDNREACEKLCVDRQRKAPEERDALWVFHFVVSAIAHNLRAPSASALWMILPHGHNAEAADLVRSFVPWDVIAKALELPPQP